MSPAKSKKPSGVNMRRFNLSAAAILVAAAISSNIAFSANAADSASEMVVVHVEGAPFERGAVINGDRRLKLEAGWSLTLVSSDGTFVTLKGPSHSVPRQAKNVLRGDPKIIEALGALLTGERRSTAALGVMRSASQTPAASPPNAWAASVERSGVRCVRSDVAMLWRSDAQSAANLRIIHAAGSRSSKATWPAGQETLALKGDAFRDGESYAIVVDRRRVDITMHVMPRGLNGQVQQAAWMARAGCRSQALALIDQIR